MSARARVLVILFVPFVVNMIALIITCIIAYLLVPGYPWIKSVETLKILSVIFSYEEALMILFLVSLGLFLLRHTRGMYNIGWIDLPLALGLIAFAFIISPLREIAYTLIYGESFSEYVEWYENLIRVSPMWARYMNALIAPFSTGIFEEVIWRGYGITKLEEFMSSWKAVVVQAIAFSLWHISPEYMISVLPFGLVCGFIFVRRRSLVPLISAHAAIDLIALSSWLP